MGNRIREKITRMEEKYSRGWWWSLRKRICVRKSAPARGKLTDDDDDSSISQTWETVVQYSSFLDICTGGWKENAAT